jgi:hypothetical protein
VHGPEHPETLRTAANLASSLAHQDKYVEAEEIGREVLRVRKRVLGAEHPDSLETARCLAQFLSKQGKHAEAEAIHRVVLGAQKRILGPEHPDTLTTAEGLALSVGQQGNFDEAKQILQATLASHQRVLGLAHPTTLATASCLERVHGAMRSQSPFYTKLSTELGATAATGSARPLPAGTRVLVQRLVAKPEHNGRRARVLSFDERGGRYVVVLDEGKELSLKAECVARVRTRATGCAVAGCPSEEVSSVCARCQAVRYCSRECQRADWKAHKPACVASPRHMS